MEPQRDFCELLECFNASRVSVLIVGAYALGYHGAPRMTGDLDLLVQPSTEYAKRVIDALPAFGFDNVGLSAGLPEQTRSRSTLAARELWTGARAPRRSLAEQHRAWRGSGDPAEAQAPYAAFELRREHASRRSSGHHLRASRRAAMSSPARGVLLTT
jgi:hypothetical protein